MRCRKSGCWALIPLTHPATCRQRPPTMAPISKASCAIPRRNESRMRARREPRPARLRLPVALGGDVRLRLAEHLGDVQAIVVVEAIDILDGAVLGPVAARHLDA